MKPKTPTQPLFTTSDACQSATSFELNDAAGIHRLVACAKAMPYPVALCGTGLRRVDTTRLCVVDEVRRILKSELVGNVARAVSALNANMASSGRVRSARVQTTLSIKQTECMELIDTFSVDGEDALECLSMACLAVAGDAQAYGAPGCAAALELMDALGSSVCAARGYLARWGALRRTGENQVGSPADLTTV